MVLLQMQHILLILMEKAFQHTFGFFQLVSDPLWNLSFTHSNSSLLHLLNYLFCHVEFFFYPISGSVVFSYDVQHHPDRPGQFSYLRALVLIPKIKADFSDIVITEALPKHLLCRIRQLMCFIDNQCSVVF